MCLIPVVSFGVLYLVSIRHQQAPELYSYWDKQLLKPGDWWKWPWWAVKRLRHAANYACEPLGPVTLVAGAVAAWLWWKAGRRVLAASLVLPILITLVAATFGRYPMGGRSHAVSGSDVSPARGTGDYVLRWTVGAMAAMAGSVATGTGRDCRVHGCAGGVFPGGSAQSAACPAGGGVCAAALERAGPHLCAAYGMGPIPGVLAGWTRAAEVLARADKQPGRGVVLAGDCVCGRPRAQGEASVAGTVRCGGPAAESSTSAVAGRRSITGDGQLPSRWRGKRRER